MNRIFTFCIILAFANLGCGKQDNSHGARTYSDNIRIDTCFLIRDIPQSMTFINKSPKEFVIMNEINDDCIMSLLDSLAERFVLTSSIEYLVCIDSLSTVADGCLAEDLTEVFQRLYTKKFNGFYDYLYSKRKIKDNTFEYFFIAGIGEEIVYDHRDRNQLLELFNKQIKQSEVSAKQIQYLHQIFYRVDEHIKRLNED